jgi:O-antigen ligase
MTSPASRFLAILSALVVVTVVATATAMVPGSLDVFRTPKDIALFILCLLLLGVGMAGALLSDDVARLFDVRGPALLVALAAAAWTGIVSIVSLRPAVSVWKPLTAVSFAVLFAATLVAARRWRLAAVVAVLVPAAVNAALALSQSTKIWMPWIVDPRIPERLRTTGLVGNPNDLGTYLVLPALAATAAAIAWPRQKWLYLMVFLLVVGIVSAQSVTPLGALVAGFFAMGMTSSTRRLRIGGLAAVVLIAAIAVIHPGSRLRLEQLVESARGGRLPEMTSNRIVPAVTALRMFRQHPLTGVGPGTFSAVYMSAKLQTDIDHPAWIRDGNEAFGQVHNDHLQVLAETGLPGYALFLTALVLLGAITFRRVEISDQPPDPRVRFARTLAFPAAFAFATLTVAQFPLQLTAPMVPAVYLAALCFAWTAPDESA